MNYCINKPIWESQDSVYSLEIDNKEVSSFKLEKVSEINGVVYKIKKNFLFYDRLCLVCNKKKFHLSIVTAEDETFFKIQGKGVTFTQENVHKFVAVVADKKVTIRCYPKEECLKFRFCANPDEIAPVVIGLLFCYFNYLGGGGF